jgi:NAD(P)H-dependent flavin oxidoreductase YrpB (nitropropane dioxygenase family)
MLSTRFTTLVGCTVPIQQAGMGGVAGPRLAGAVAAAGALGMVGSARIPAPVLTRMLDQLRQDAAGPVGVNVLIPFLDLACVEVAASRVRVVEFFYASPDPALIRTVHAGGALACWQIGSEEEARAAADAGADLIVAQGMEAGGHVRGTIGLLPLLDRVLGAVSVPVIAAGGIATARGMAAALAAGADAVRVGTRFVVAEESDAHPQYQDALIQAGAGDTVLTEAFSVMWPHAPHRVLRSAVEAAQAHPSDQVGEMVLGGERLPLPRFAVPTPTRQTTGAIGAMALYAGQSVGAVQARQPAAEIIRELADGAARLLARWSHAPAGARV